MHPRKRASWPITVYRYWVSLEQDAWPDLPTSIKHEAEAMRTLWNQLVAAFAQHQAAYQKTRQASPEAHPETESALRPSQSQIVRQLRESFAQEAQRLTVASPAAWANSRFILTQFQATVGRYFRHHGNPPRLKTDTFRQVHFCHQFTAGGLPVERIFGQVQRLHLDPVPPEAFHLTCPQRQRKRLARTSGSVSSRCHSPPLQDDPPSPTSDRCLSQDRRARGKKDWDRWLSQCSQRWPPYSSPLAMVPPSHSGESSSHCPGTKTGNRRLRHFVSKARYGRALNYASAC